MAVGFGYRYDGLEQVTFAFLYILTHRVQVGSEVHRCRENTFVLFAFALPVELFPPFADVVEFGVVVDKQFYFLALSVQVVACGSVEQCGIVVKVCSRSAAVHHLFRTVQQGVDVQSGAGDGQQSYGTQYRESSAYVVLNDECVVAFLGCQCA